MARIFNVSIDSLLLDRSGMTLEVNGLKREQVKLLELLIMNFQKNNMIEDYFKQSVSEEDIKRLEKETGIKLEDIY